MLPIGFNAMFALFTGFLVLLYFLSPALSFSEFFFMFMPFFILVFFIWYYFQRKTARNRLHVLAKKVGQWKAESEQNAGSGDDRWLDPLIRSFRQTLREQDERISHLLLTEERYRTILEHLNSIVILIDGKGNISYINPSGERFFGTTRIELIGKPHWKLGSASGLSLLVNEVMQNGESLKSEIYLPVRKLMEVSIVPYGREALVVLLHDITERGEVERLRKEFIANVSHELRTPLAAIQGYAETLMNGAIKDHETAVEFLGIIYKESLRVNKMVNDLLDLSRIEHLKDPVLERVELKEIVVSAIKTLEWEAKERQLALTASLPEKPVFIQGNRDLLIQLLLNLAGNALKYTTHGMVEIKVDEPGTDGVRLHVKDTGRGIESEHLPRIFERFYRVDPSRNPSSGGRGLGLSIVKHIVQQHKGNISVTSEPGQGSCFTVVFPAVSKNNRNNLNINRR